jgi:hypothetical protein
MNVAVTGREKLFVSIAIMTACTARISPTAMFQMRSRLSLRSADWSTAILCLLFVNPILAKSSSAEKQTTVVWRKGPLPLTYSEYFCAAIRTYASVAGLPFFIFINLATWISTFFRHFMQYACNGHLLSFWKKRITHYIIRCQ